METSKSFKFIKFTQSPVIGIPFEFALSLQLVTNIKKKKNLLQLNQVLINNFEIFFIFIFLNKNVFMRKLFVSPNSLFNYILRLLLTGVLYEQDFGEISSEYIDQILR